MYSASLHAFGSIALIVLLVIWLWRKLLFVLTAVLVAAIAIGLYQIIGFIRS